MRTLLLLLLFLIFAGSAVGQAIPGPVRDNSFMDLSQRRAKLNSDIPYLNDQIDNIKIMDTTNIRRMLNDVIRKRDEAQSNFFALAGNAPGRDTLTRLIIGFNGRVVELKDTLAQAEEGWQQKQKLIGRLDSAQRALSQVDFQLNQIMIPKISQQNFLFWATIAFVALMGFLITIFLKVVSDDKKVRFAIFGSDSGLQFITLFCIVIAIILFGLTGILEGKELSALLGSVAGYILGKAKLSTDQPTRQEPEPPQPQQPQPQPQQLDPAPAPLQPHEPQPDPAQPQPQQPQPVSPQPFSPQPVSPQPVPAQPNPQLQEIPV